MKSLAAILIAQREPLAIEEVDVPPLRFGQVLVKVLTSGICGSQIGEIRGVKGPDPYLPHLLGHEGCGEVLEVGEGVRTVRPGDRVVLHWRPGSGHQGEPPKYSHPALGIVNAGFVTTFNQYAVVSENRVTTVPGDLDPAVAALFGCAVTTGFGVINNDARLKIGESVVVYGAGGVGLSIIQGAALVSGHPIVAVDLFANRLDLAARLGATHRIVAAGRTLDDVAAEVRAIVGPAGADCVIDNTGSPRVIETCYALTHKAGRTILVGVPAHDQDITIHSLPLHFEKRLAGSHGGSAQPHLDIPRYIGAMRADAYDLSRLISARFKLVEVNAAIASIQTGSTAGRVCLDIAT